MPGFFSTLNYSSVNEDWRTEATALRLDGARQVLCVTGSGARPLDLLATAPARVVAIDCNPAQNALLWLKRAAIERLPYPEYARFLGLLPAAAAGRRETCRQLCARLPDDVGRYWRAHENAVERGVLYQGRWERFHGRLARLTRLLHRRRVDTLLTFDDLEAQRRYLRQRWNDRSWRVTFDLACNGLLVRTAFGDPAYRGPGAGPAGVFCHARMGALLDRVLARDSFMVTLLLTGKLSPADLPPHLTPQGHATIRSRLDRLEVVTADLTSYLASQDADRFDRFSLSDVGSFLRPPELSRLLDAVVSAAAPGARIVLRQFLTRHHLPPSLQPRVVRETTLETLLAASDRSFAYDFLIAEVARG